MNKAKLKTYAPQARKDFTAAFNFENQNPDRGINQNHDAGFVPLF